MKFANWSEETCEKAIALRYQIGETAYEHVLKLFPLLPTARTLRRRLENFQLMPGVNKLPISFLKECFANIEPIKRRGVLVFDRMSLIEEIKEYQGESFGYDTMKNDKTSKATEGLVGLFAGTVIRFKQIIGFHLTTKSINGDHFKEFLIQLLTEIEKEQIFCDGVVFDMGFENIAMLKKFGITLEVSNEKFFITHPIDASRKLWIFIDSVHEFKNIALNFRAHDCQIPDFYVEKYNLDSNKARSAEVKKIISIQKKMIYKGAPKLTENVIKPGQFDKMRVNTHTRYFSNDVITSLEFIFENDLEDVEKFLSESLDDFIENAKRNATTWFLSMINKWINTMKSPKYHNLKDETTESLKMFLRESREIFKDIKMGSNRLVCLISAKITTNSILDIMNYYESLGIAQFCFSNFTQDCLENVFSVIRAKKKLPSSIDFVYQLRAQCVSRFTKTNVKGSSYDVDSNIIEPNISFVKIIQEYQFDNEKVSTDNNLPEKLEVLDHEYNFNLDFDFENIQLFANDFELNVFYHVAGYLIKRVFKNISCDECLKSLVDEDPIPTSYNRLLRSKNFSGSLKFVNEETFNFLLKLEKIFQKVSKLEIEQNEVDFKKEFSTFALTSLTHETVHCYESLEVLVSSFVSFRIYLTRSKRNKHTRCKYSSNSMK